MVQRPTQVLDDLSTYTGGWNLSKATYGYGFGILDKPQYRDIGIFVDQKLKVGRRIFHDIEVIFEGTVCELDE